MVVPAYWSKCLGPEGIPKFVSQASLRLPSSDSRKSKALRACTASSATTV